MPRRYYLCKIIGDGLTPLTAQRPAVVDVLPPSASYSVVLATGADGKPLFPWCVCIVNVADHSLLPSRDDVDGFGSVALSRTIASLTAGQRTYVRSLLSKYGINQVSFSDGDTIGECLRKLVRRHQANVELSHFDAPDVG